MRCRRRRRGLTTHALAGLLALLAVFLAAPEITRADGEPLRVGLTGKYPPFNYFDEAGRLIGFDVEVARAVCSELGRDCKFEIMAWDGILASLLAGKIDVIIGSMAVTDERSRRVDFSRPYYESGAQLFIRPGLDAGAPERPGFRVGVTLGTTYETFVQEAFPGAEIRTYKGDTEIFQDARAGRLDGMVTDRLAGAYLNKRHSAGLELVGEPLFLERIAIPVRPGEAELLAGIDRAIARLRGSPVYAEMMDRYFGLSSAARGSGGEPAFRWQAAARLLLRGFVATAKVALLGVGLGCLLALALAASMITAPAPVRWMLVFLVDFIRSTPFLIQLFAIYFGLPAAGIRLDAFTSAVLAIALHSAAYLSEVVKTAYLSVPPGQRHAAATLGLTRWEALRHVVWPQMLPLMTAPALNTVVAMIKDSAVVSVISVYELTQQTQQLISATFRPLELYLAAALLYFILTYPLLMLGRAQETRYRRRGLLA